ncbi:MAG: sensor histidine kinase [Geminicoccales bacterium]
MSNLAAPQHQASDAERLAALGKLTAGVAHEIKNPLNFVNNFSRLSLDLMDEALEALSPALSVLDQDRKAEVDELFELVRQNLIKINQHGRRANSIVRTMLMHARRGADNTQAASLNDLVMEVIGLVKHDLELLSSDQLVPFKLDLSPDIDAIECFPEDLIRALSNLVTNAVHATQSHDGQEDPEVTIATKAIDDRIQVTIRDNGIGMAGDVLDQALTPFFTTKPPGEGTGLGLSLAHDVIIRQHRGEFTLVSEPDQFTSVTITLFKKLPERRSGGRRSDDG